MSARFAILPAHAADDPELSTLELRVLIAIGRHLNRENEAWPSQTLLAEKLGKTRESINRAIRVLKDRGYLRVQHTTRDDGGNGAAVYQVILEPQTIPVFASDAERHRGEGGDAERQGGSDVQTSHARELPNRTHSSEAKASGVPAELFPESDPPKPKPAPAAPADPDPFNAMIWTAGLKLLTDANMREGPARAFLGRLIKQARGDTAIVANAVTACQMARAGDPGAWLQAAVRKRLPGTVEHRKASADEKAAELELRFRHFAAGKGWKIHWGPAPDDPDADYPDALYAKTGVKRWEAVS